ncbi:MAG: hypothetical protein [Olavius algarvensis Gamma 1 endosymbiont]|nr:MAG: hypothetical protein [Olavius algarvensis Gamma 1 endosymbiont]
MITNETTYSITSKISTTKRFFCREPRSSVPGGRESRLAQSRQASGR